jgi:hypothetical protein
LRESPVNGLTGLIVDDPGVVLLYPSSLYLLIYLAGLVVILTKDRIN